MYQTDLICTYKNIDDTNEQEDYTEFSYYRHLTSIYGMIKK